MLSTSASVSIGSTLFVSSLGSGDTVVLFAGTLFDGSSTAIYSLKISAS
jgi:hypothetical protein